MSAVEHYVERYRAAVQRHLPDELILAVGLFTRARHVDRTGRHRPWLADDVALGAGTARLVAVHFRPVGMDIDTLALLATWGRDDVRIRLEETTVMRLLRLSPDAGDEIELRSSRQLGAFDRMNDALYRQLGLSPAIPAN